MTFKVWLGLGKRVHNHGNGSERKFNLQSIQCLLGYFSPDGSTCFVPRGLQGIQGVVTFYNMFKLIGKSHVAI